MGRFCEYFVMNPEILTSEFVSMGRGTGRTAKLIASLPNERCAVMSSTLINSKNLKKRVIKERPDLNVNNILFLAYMPNTGWRDHLLLKDIHVYFDNDVLDDIIVHHVRTINAQYGKRVTSL